MKPSTTLMIALLAASPFPVMAQTGFVWKPAAPAVASAPVTVAPMAAQPGFGYGDNLPLMLAMQQIVPPGVRYAIDPLSADTLVSWRGSSTWDTTILDIANRHNLTAAFGEGSVTIGPRVPTAGAAAAPVSILPAQQAAPATAAAAPAAPDVAIPQINPTSLATGKAIQDQSFDVWEVTEGRTLRQELARWCEKAGWKLIYRIEWDYPLEAAAVFTGTFEDAVKGLMEALQNNRPQPRAGFAKDNKALVILKDSGTVN